jgi:hypothetical protein
LRKSFFWLFSHRSDKSANKTSQFLLIEPIQTVAIRCRTPNVTKKKTPKIDANLAVNLTAKATLKGASPEGNLLPHKRNVLF